MSNMRYNEEYMYGSEAPQRTYDEPVRRRRNVEPLTKEERRKEQQNRYAQENRRRAAKFGGLYTMFLTCAVGVMLFVCVNYISVINVKTNNSKKISSLQQEVMKAREENDLKKLSIDTSVDYDYIYNVATEELGMVYVGKDQIKNYTSGEGEYVIQYSDIPSK